MLFSQKVGIAGGSVIAFSVIFGFLAFDEILEFAIKDQVSLRKRNEIRRIYLKIPFPLNFSVYFFNVSNPMEVQSGGTPILTQVGPYRYDEYIEKVDVVDNEGDDSLTYNPYVVFKFNEEKSGTLRDDDLVTILHPLIIFVDCILFYPASEFLLCNIRPFNDLIVGENKGWYLSAYEDQNICATKNKLRRFDLEDLDDGGINHLKLTVLLNNLKFDKNEEHYIFGMVNQVNRDSPALLPILNKAIGLLYPDLQSVYLTAKVKDILFDGLTINCKVSDFPAKAVCTQLKSRIPGLKITKDDVYLFSILGMRNATVGPRVKVSRGISNSKNVGKILEVDGKRELNFWKTKECNTLKGTDGWIFPPALNPEDGIWSYSTDLCRSVSANFVEDTVLKGVNVRRYEADLGDMEHNEEEKCYCDTPKTCLKKGVFDMSKCLGVPIYATLPHFLRTDESYIKQVKGLSPVLEDHIINLFFEPMTSTPIEAYKRIQFNFAIAPNSKITLMKTIPEALHPVFWIEETVSLEGQLLKKVTNIFLLIKIVKILRWVGVLFGGGIIFYSIFDYFRENKKVQITPDDQPETISNEGNEVTPSKIDTFDNKTGSPKTRTVLNGHAFDKY